MMSLVAYGSSGESDSDTEDTSDTNVSASNSVSKEDNLTLPSSSASKAAVNIRGEAGTSSLHSKLPAPTKNIVAKRSDEETSSTLSISSKLPAPKQHALSSLNFPIKEMKSGAKKGPVKIMIPALSDFPDDEDEPKPKKKIQPSAKGSGLFALLPPPKQEPVKEANRSLVPNSVLRRPPKPTPPINKKKPPTKVLTTKPMKEKKESDSESDGETPDADFFSLNKDEEIPPLPDVVTPVVEGNGMYASSVQWQYENQDAQQFQDFNHTPETPEIPMETYPEACQDFIPVTTNNLELDDEAIMQLCGRQGKRRREEVQIVDVSGDSLMPNQREWLTKQLTEEQPRSSSSKSKLFGPSSQQRRKHQITYLAHVAKENELELKNSWANNRQTRKQTQSKYGF